MTSSFFLVAKLLDSSRLNQLGLHKFREEKRFERGILVGLTLGLVIALTASSRLEPFDREQIMWFAFGVLPHALIWAILEDNLMRQTAALLDEPTG